LTTDLWSFFKAKASVLASFSNIANCLLASVKAAPVGLFFLLKPLAVKYSCFLIKKRSLQEYNFFL
jgi:hypothetical protein